MDDEERYERIQCRAIQGVPIDNMNPTEEERRLYDGIRREVEEAEKSGKPVIFDIVD